MRNTPQNKKNFTTTSSPFKSLECLIVELPKHLNDKGITTHRGNKWGITGNSVYSVLIRHKERENRLMDMQREYKPVWGTMKVIWERNPD